MGKFSRVGWVKTHRLIRVGAGYSRPALFSTATFDRSLVYMEDDKVPTTERWKSSVMMGCSTKPKTSSQTKAHTTKICQFIKQLTR